MKRSETRFLVVVALFALALAPACNRYALRPTGGDGQDSFSTTSQISVGKDFTWIADLRASWIAGPGEDFLPIHIAVLNDSKEPLRFTRESFTLELTTDDGEKIVLPMASSEEVEKEHGRQRMDVRIGNQFLEVINGRYPSPPFFKRPLEFFSLLGSSVVPRKEISLRQAELAQGLIYFRLPKDRPPPEKTEFKLLFQPSPTTDGEPRERNVLSIQPYED